MAATSMDPALLPAAVPKAPTATLSFNHVFHVVKATASEGHAKFHPSGLAFKITKTAKVTSVTHTEMHAARWMRVARGFQLFLELKSGATVTLDGFRAADRDTLFEFFKTHFHIDVRDVEPNVKGFNWGVPMFSGPFLSFMVDGAPAFEIALTDVSNATLTQKQEVMLDFHPDEEGDQDTQVLESVRFHFPKAAVDDGDDEGAGGAEAKDEDGLRAEDFVARVLDKANVIQLSGEALATFAEMPCLTPRGRYDLDLFPTSLRLHGKTFDFKIPYSTVIRLFLLQKPDQHHVFFVLALDPPNRKYPFVVLQFPIDDEIDSLEVKLDGVEEDVRAKFTDVATTLHGPTYEVVGQLFKTMTGRKVCVSACVMSHAADLGAQITVPGTFRSHSQVQAVSCSHKAADGYLYPLEKGFMFLHKPPIHLRFDEIASVGFDRVSAVRGESSRSFDLNIELKSGATFEFKSIPRDEYKGLYAFIDGKKLRIRNLAKQSAKDADDEESDAFVGSDDENTASTFKDARPDFDPYLNRVREEGRQATGDRKAARAAAGAGGGGGGDSSDSSDEDFDGNAEQSDAREEFDSNASTSSSSDSGSAAGSGDEEGGSKGGAEEGDSEAAAKKREKKAKAKAERQREKERKREKEKKRAEKKRKASSGSEASGAEGGDDDGASKKPAKKKAKKDPNAPKKPPSSYLLFCNATRAALKEEHPEMKLTDMAKEFGVRWKALDAEGRASYEEQAAAASATYKEALRVYNASKPADVDGGDDAAADEGAGPGAAAGPKAKAKRDPNMPKKPMSAFMLFLGKKREQIKASSPGISFGDITKRGSELWKALAADGKSDFETDAAALKDTYDKAMAVYKAENPDAAVKKPATASGGKANKASVPKKQTTLPFNVKKILSEEKILSDSD